MSTSIAAEAYHRAIAVTRADVFGPSPDRQLPKHLHEDAQVPFLGFAGQNYRAGGTLLVAINPGGGMDTDRVRPPKDAELIPYLFAFRLSAPENVSVRFAEMSHNYMKQAKTWNLWRIIQPVIAAAGKSADEIAFANICPFRTRENRTPHKWPLQNTLDRVAKPLIAGLQAGTVIVLGQKAGTALEGHPITSGAYFVVPRTNGDHYVSADAQVVLESLRKHAS